MHVVDQPRRLVGLVQWTLTENHVSGPLNRPHNASHERRVRADARTCAGPAGVRPGALSRYGSRLESSQMR